MPERIVETCDQRPTLSVCVGLQVEQVLLASSVINIHHVGLPEISDQRRHRLEQLVRALIQPILLITPVIL